jgi:hypothetical protein
MSHRTFCSVPLSPKSTSSVLAGEECILAQFGTAAMLMTFILRGTPSNLTTPVTEPVVAASTGFETEFDTGRSSSDVVEASGLFVQPAMNASITTAATKLNLRSAFFIKHKTPMFEKRSNSSAAIKLSCATRTYRKT